jgi:hypothetical protein
VTYHCLFWIRSRLVYLKHIKQTTCIYNNSDFEDVNVGYQFANVLYRDADSGILKVDLDLINDVRVQRGGGNEPLLRASDEEDKEIDVATDAHE